MCNIERVPNARDARCSMLDARCFAAGLGQVQAKCLIQGETFIEQAPHTAHPALLHRLPSRRCRLGHRGVSGIPGLAGLDELAQAGCAALTSPLHAQAQVSFVDEPGELVLHVAAAGDVDAVQPSLTRYPDWVTTWNIGRAEDCEVLGGMTLPRAVFARAVCDAVQAVRNAMTPEAYQQRWHAHAFPSEQLARLHALLREHKNK